MHQHQEFSFTRDIGRVELLPSRGANQIGRRIRLAVPTVLATLLLASCGGSSGENSLPAPPPVTPQAPPVQNLLNNQQLSTSIDANEALVDSDAATWFGQNAKIVRSLTIATDFSDLAFLGTTLQNKRLVMLGESSHGVKEYSQAKVRLIKYLHEEQGFNVLAFEGGLFDCENAQRLIANSTPRIAMNSCLFGVWRTQTLRELFEYIKDTQSSNNPLRITGFDVQASGFAADQRADYTADMIAKVSATYATEVRELEQTFYQLTSNAVTARGSNDPALVSLTSELDNLAASYSILADFLQANVSTIAADEEFSEREVLIAAQYARTSPFYAEQISQRFQFEGGGRARDQGMAENLIALSTSLYPNEKIIGWAHNAHLRHQGTGFLPDGNMGTLVHNALESDLYTIGFYMYRGQHAFNDRSIQEVSAPIDFSLEAIFYTRRLAWLFLDLENETPDQTGAEWLTQTTPTWAWGRFSVPLRLSAEYDGVFIIDTVTPPDDLYQ